MVKGILELYPSLWSLAGVVVPGQSQYTENEKWWLIDLETTHWREIAHSITPVNIAELTEGVEILLWACFSMAYLVASN